MANVLLLVLLTIISFADYKDAGRFISEEGKSALREHFNEGAEPGRLSRSSYNADHTANGLALGSPRRKDRAILPANLVHGAASNSLTRTKKRKHWKKRPASPQSRPASPKPVTPKPYPRTSVKSSKSASTTASQKTTTIVSTMPTKPKQTPPQPLPPKPPPAAQVPPSTPNIQVTSPEYTTSSGLTTDSEMTETTEEEEEDPPGPKHGRRQIPTRPATKRSDTAIGTIVIIMVAVVCFVLVFIVAGTVIVAVLINKRKKKKEKEERIKNRKLKSPRKMESANIYETKFIHEGPIVMERKLRGPVEFHGEQDGGTIQSIKFDPNLNEVVDIGTDVDIITPGQTTTHTEDTSQLGKASVAQIGKQVMQKFSLRRRVKSNPPPAQPAHHTPAAMAPRVAAAANPTEPTPNHAQHK